MADVVCVGILVADCVGKPVEGLPERGKLALLDQLELHLGGNASNTALGLAKIGISSAIIGKVGRDGFGDFLESTLKRAGVDTSGLVHDARSHTSSTMVMVHPDGERSFLHYLGANAFFGEDDIAWNLIRPAKVMHIGGHFLMSAFDGEPAARALKQAKDLGITTCLDPCWDSKGRWMNLVRPCLQYTDYFLPSIEEAKQIASREDPGEIADALLSEGVGTVGLKMAEQGCLIKSYDHELRLPAFQIDPVDATGAGDAFVTGFLTGVVNGWDLEQTGRFANAVGAMATLAIGTTAGVRSMAETQAFMEGTPLRK